MSNLPKRSYQERQVNLSADRIRRVLKKRGTEGSEPGTATVPNRTQSKSNAKLADLATLEVAAQDGHIDLKYLDECGFCLWSPVSYSGASS